MKVQLLLLLALAGSLCSFTRASPTEVPSDLEDDITTPISEGLMEEETLNIITGPPPTNPPAVPDVVMDRTTSATSQEVTENLTTERDPIIDTTPGVPESTPGYTSPSAEITLSPSMTTAAWALKSTVPEETTGPLTEETDAATDPRLSEDQTEGTDIDNKDTKLENDNILEEGLSTGQIVGIVIGGIVAVVIVIAVVIALFRRMGKYSP